MANDGTVKWINAKNGLTGIALDDGTHVLLEPLQAGSLQIGTRLTGNMRSLGDVALKLAKSDQIWKGFVVAYDLSEAAVILAMR